MTPALTIDAAARFAGGLEAREQRRTGGTREDARARVASRTGVLASTLEMLARGRLKRLEAWVFMRLAAAVETELQAEIARHQHDLAIARQCRRDSDPREIEEGIARLERALALLASSNR